LGSFRICFGVYDSSRLSVEESGFEILEDYNYVVSGNLFDYFIKRGI
jgi:hypothetical protein